MNGIRYRLGARDGNLTLKLCENATHASRSHFHNELSLILVEKGSGQAEIAGQHLEIEAGTVLVIPPGTTHCCRPHNVRAWRFRMLYADVLPDFPEETMPGFRCCVPSRADRRALRSLFDSLEQGGVDPGRLRLLLRSLGGPPVCRRASDAPGLERVRRLLEADCTRPCTLDELAEAAGLSKCHLVRCFQQRYGLTPHRYLMNLRINRGRTLLKKGEPISDAALRAGFCDQSHFTRLFKAYTGVSPSCFRRS